ncbi:hypothetical protein P7M41_26335, partial [Vibrio parahaemolyticus]|nr:hypothetical protein [Vibrio parahaemolyticus]
MDAGVTCRCQVGASREILKYLVSSFRKKKKQGNREKITQKNRKYYHEKQGKNDTKKKQKKTCPQWGTPLKTPLIPDSCCVLHHSHNPSVLFISPACFLSSYIDLAMSAYLYLLYFLSSHFARTQPCMHTYTHTGFRNQNQSCHWSGSQQMKGGQSV